MSKKTASRPFILIILLASFSTVKYTADDEASRLIPCSRSRFKADPIDELYATIWPNFIPPGPQLRTAEATFC
jgi:hypothetical protein